jgi:hypothetical protein
VIQTLDRAIVLFGVLVAVLALVFGIAVVVGIVFR